MGMGMLQVLSLLLKICAIAFSWLLLASPGYSLSPASSAIPPISNGTASANTAPTPTSWPNGKDLNAPTVLPNAPTIVPSNDLSPLPLIRQDTISSPPPINEGHVEISPLSGPQRKPSSIEPPALAPESPVKDESPLRKSPPNPPAMQPVVTGSVPPSPPGSGTPDTPLPVPIAPAPFEPPLRKLPENPPTMPPRPHQNGPPDTALPMPIPPAPIEPPLKKSPEIPPIRQPVVPGSSPPAPHENGPPDTPIPVPISPATAEPPLRELPQNPPARQPVVTGSVPPSPHGNIPPPVSIAPVPDGAPLRKPPQNPPAMQPVVIGSRPPSPHENGPADTPLPLPIAPVPSATEHRNPKNTPSNHSAKPAVSPSTPAVTHDISPVSTPLPSINRERVATPVAAAPNRMTNHDFSVHTSPAQAPSTHKTTRHSSNAASPRHSPNFPPEKGSHAPSYPPSALPMRHHFVKGNITVAPLSHAIPPASTTQGPSFAPVPSFHSKSDPKSTHRQHAQSPLSSAPFPSDKISPTGSSARNPKKLFPPPFHALPPPPPNEDCSSLKCTEPLASPPPKSPCYCVLPIRIGLRLSVALYTFFPLVSELANEIAAGVFMDTSQVRIMGANAGSQYPEKTIVLIDLVPLGGHFDNTKAFVTFQRFWHKDVVIKSSYFGDYDVLYVQYPGLPPSPPSAHSSAGIIGSDPYSGDNGRTIQPLGVDVTRKKHGDGPNRSVVAVIVLSASVAVILCCAVAWVLLFKHRDRACQSGPTPPTAMPSLAKSPASIIGSVPNSPSLSFSSSFAAYTGSAKTFSSTDIERATNNFNETRILGEGGFGRVYSGVVDDGTEVAVKILKRDDHQGGREFLAEVEMLSRLHHRNLVKLIGICLEERSRCLVYELIPNGSVESHLHGVDKETAPLDWNARVKIALGAARGLAYLHEDSSPRVIHRDFKSSNILLEHDFTPKVSDFGLARTAFDEENRHISTRVMGTFGYVAPEYAMTGHLLVKSDVYSYGVVLLELLTGRKPVDMSLPPGQENLVSWARPFLTTKEGLEFIVDPSLGPDFPVDSITKVAAIASMCVQPEVSHRPFMGEVVQALKLVCNECDETKDLESQSCNQEDMLSSSDMDARFSTASGHTMDPLHAHSPRSNTDCELDLERGHSMSDLLSSSMRYGMRCESGSLGIHSRSGTLRTGKARRLWRKMTQLSGGSVSEHGVLFRLWPGSN
ncbi:receptor-like serine/threonine-protein kinase ALE2 isoform X2 [Ipomoea triloba]|uniref:receptor-like serine/threonine-protein kinase ALE2 isoform X2 n=1 Tax=Ipomoea triloba TaxID=35885 RepID=UPI00125E7920|nr:receptor-like serine/threonine-protein kinase ALE2 isoform X2 [Ipomoea triloba]